jgi:membrane protein
VTATATESVQPRRSWAARAAIRARRSLRLGYRAAWRGFVEFYDSENLTFAGSIAYYTLLSLFPFLLLVLALAGNLWAGHEQEIFVIIERALPGRGEMVRILEELRTVPLNLTLAGVALMLWASMGVFGAITSAVNHAWGVETPLGFFKHKLIAFIMLVASGLLLIAAIGLVSAVQVIEARWFSGIVAQFPGLADLTGFAYRYAPTPMIVLVVGLIYYFVPNAQVRLRDVWFGAVLAGVLWTLALSGFSWYVRDVSRFSFHGSIAAIVIFLVWVYLSAVILLYGVEVTAAYARLRKHLPQEAPAAPARDVETRKPTPA